MTRCWWKAPLAACAIAMMTLPLAAQAAPVAGVSELDWGKAPDGAVIRRYTITNRHGASVSILNLGATIASLRVPDRAGKLEDVVLGYAKAEDYLRNGAFYGATVGRYANRIVGSKLTIDGKTYALDGFGGAILHGGPKGFHTRMWSVATIKTAQGPALRFTLVSPDGDEGFPGKLTATVTFAWDDSDRLTIDYRATTTKTTVVNLTQHSYFNLAGAGHGDILGERLRINADFYTPSGPNNTPTGEVLKVAGTPFDFTTAKPLGQDINSPDPQVARGHGYDHNFVLRRSMVPGEVVEAAHLADPASGRTLTVSTSEPGLQLYTANGPGSPRPMRDGLTYPAHAGVAMETEHYPDTPNLTHFPHVVLRPGEVYSSRTIWQFGVEGGSR
ncbi:MAG: galactose mutarotase [Sphingomonadales bacterium]|nr:galactose mutarotase [Sphingomonadales bacterium]